MIIRVFAVAAAVAALTACASSVTGTGHAAALSHSTFPTSTSPSPSATVPSDSAFAVPAPSDWKVNRDTLTGIQFQLPGIATPAQQNVQMQDGKSAGARLYNIQLGTDSDGAAVGVTIIGSNDQRVVPDLDEYAQSFKIQFLRAGATDAQILELRHFAVDGKKALDYRISFTSQASNHAKAVWLVRLIDDDGRLIVAQTISFSVDPDALLPKIRNIQSYLASHLQVV
jgi:hypothetical protein